VLCNWQYHRKPLATKTGKNAPCKKKTEGMIDINDLSYNYVIIYTWTCIVYTSLVPRPSVTEGLGTRLVYTSVSHIWTFHSHEQGWVQRCSDKWGSTVYCFTQYHNYWIHIAVIECISCTRAVLVSLFCGQLFGVKTYSYVSLIYICYWYQSHPLPNILIYQANNWYATL